MTKEVSRYIAPFETRSSIDHSGEIGLDEELYAVEKSTREFLLTCIEKGTIEHIPERFSSMLMRHNQRSLREDQLKTNSKVWQKNLEIVFRYFLNYETLQEIGDRFGVLRGSIQYYIDTTLEDLWTNSSEELQKRYPLETLSRKINRREINRRNLLDNLPPIESLTSAQRGHLRIRLGPDSDRVPLVNREQAQNQELARRLQEANSDEAIAELIVKVNHNFYRRYSRSEATDKPILMSIRNVAALANMSHYPNNKTDMLIQALQDAQPPIPFSFITQEVHSGKQKGIQKTYFIAAQHQNRAIMAFQDSQELEGFFINPVEKIAGPDREDSVRLIDFISGNGLVSVGRLLEETGLKVRRINQKIKIVDFFADNACPIPIYRYTFSNGQSQYKYHTYDEEELRKYIQARRKGLGL